MDKLGDVHLVEKWIDHCGVCVTSTAKESVKINNIGGIPSVELQIN